MTMEELRVAILKMALNSTEAGGLPATLTGLGNAVNEPDVRRLLDALNLMHAAKHIRLSRFRGRSGRPERWDGDARDLGRFLDGAEGFRVEHEPSGRVWYEERVAAKEITASPAAVDASDEADPRSFCQACRRDQEHVVIRSYSRPLHEGDLEGGVLSDKWQIARCGGCSEHAFRRVIANSNDLDPELGRVEPFTVVYVEGTSDMREPVEIPTLPRTVDRIYRETVDAWNVGARTLCAGGLRATLEAVCAERGVIDGPVPGQQSTAGSNPNPKRSDKLHGKIEGLAEKLLLTVSQAADLHAIRFLGNDALHDLAEPTREELRLAFALIEQTLDLIYVRSGTSATLNQLRDTRAP